MVPFSTWQRVLETISSPLFLSPVLSMLGRGPHFTAVPVLGLCWLNSRCLAILTYDLMMVLMTGPIFQD